MNRMMRILLLGSLVLSSSFMAKAQKRAVSPFQLNVVGESTNFWSNDYLALPAALVNYGLTRLFEGDVEDGFGTTALNFDLFSVKQNGVKVRNNNGKYFGFKAKDMFSNVNYGLRFGYQATYVPIGVYVSCLYNYRRFEADLGVGGQTEKFKMHNIKPGIGVRLTPFIGMLEKEGLSPMLEAGVAYTAVLAAEGPYNNDKDQFKGGLSSNYALGVRFGNNNVSAGVEVNHYNVFNEDFTPDGGITYPYQGVKTSHYTISIRYAHVF